MNALLPDIPFDPAQSAHISITDQTHPGPFHLSCLGEVENCDPDLGKYVLQTSILLGRFRALSEAMACAVRRGAQTDLCIDGVSGFTPNLLIIHDIRQHLCLAGQISRTGLTWCDPVTSDAEARRVVLDASRLRAEATRETDQNNLSAARALRFRAGALEGRLVDPCYRTVKEVQLAQAA